jgi:hypothetical protein
MVLHFSGGQAQKVVSVESFLPQFEPTGQQSNRFFRKALFII